MEHDDLTTLPPPSLSDPDLHISRLANGLTVATLPMPWLHEVGVNLIFRAGSRHERDSESGIAHFLEHMLFKGTRRIPEPTALHTHLESLAADMNAVTGQEINGYFLSLPPEHLEEGMKIFCEMFSQPAFNGIETERQVVLSEMHEDENEQGALINPMLLAGQVLWKEHPLARSVLGNRQSVPAIGTKQLHNYLGRHYCGPTAALACYGPITPQRVDELAARYLDFLPDEAPDLPQAPPAMAPGPHWVAVDDPGSQYALSIYSRCDGYTSDDAIHMSAMQRLLDDGFASRLQARMREARGLVYDVWAALISYSDAGALELGAYVAPDNLHAVFQGLIREIDLLKQHPPDREEWQRLTTRWRAALMGSLDRPVEMIDRYVTDDLFNAVTPLPEAWRRVQALTSEAVRETATRRLSVENRVIVLVGPQATREMERLKALHHSPRL